MKKIYCLLCIIFVLFPLYGSAQVKHTNTNFIWLNYNQSIQLHHKWTLLNDIQFRTKNWFQYQSLIAVRSGIAYAINKHTNAAAGFAWFANFRNVNDATVIANEYRLWQDVSFQSPWNNKVISNRVRLEERFLQQIINGALSNKYDKKLRLRYKVEIGIPILKSNVTCNIGNEVMVNIDYIHSNQFFDQNRAYFFLNIPMVKNTLFQFQYIKIFQWQVNNNILDNQNVFRFSVHQKLNIKK